MEHKAWVKEATGDSMRGVARTIGVDSAQLSRELGRG